MCREDSGIMGLGKFMARGRGIVERMERKVPGQGVQCVCVRTGRTCEHVKELRIKSENGGNNFFGVQNLNRTTSLMDKAIDLG